MKGKHGFNKVSPSYSREEIPWRPYLLHKEKKAGIRLPRTLFYSAEQYFQEFWSPLDTVK